MIQTLISLRTAAFAAALAFTAAGGALELRSPNLPDSADLLNRHVLNGFGCSGENLSPALVWDKVPQGTKSFAVTLYDPDAPTGSGWWHWVVFNLPANTRALPENAGTPDGGKLPKGSVQSRTDFGAPGYGGACPPQGDKPHRYQLTLFALDVDSLPLSADASAAMVGFYLNSHTLEKTQVTWRYGRP